MTPVSHAMDPRDALAHALQRYRARLILVGAGRYAASAILVAIGLAAIAAALWRLDPRAAIALAAALVALAALGSLVAAQMSAPSLARTAALLDRRLGSNDCLVTAVECLGASDPVADLVVREGLRRLDGAAPKATLPLEWPRRIGVLSAAAVSTIVVMSAIEWNRSVPAAGSESVAGRSIPATDRSAPAGRGQQPRAANSPATTADASPSARAIPAAPDPHANQSRVADGDSAAGRSGSENGRAADRSNAPADSPRASNDPSPSGTNADPNAATAAGGSRSDSATARGDRGAAAGAPNGSGGGGRSATLAARASQGAGGVSGGSLSNASAGDRSDAPRSPQSAAQTTDAAWTRAQAAIARDRIPADLRQLVQDYFTAIRRARR
jgi:hypothetical protein